MEFVKGQLITGNDGKVRKILDVFDEYQGKEGTYIQWNQMKDGKFFGKASYARIDKKLPVWI